MSYTLMTKLKKRIPIIETLENYNKEFLKQDFIAALTVAVMGIPQSMAYAIIAGVNPVYGLYTAIVSSILGSIFGSSNHLITGPTNAIALLLAGSLKDYIDGPQGYELLFLMTFVIGLIQILFGIIKLGKVTDYVSRPVIVGFTAGAGVLITMNQLNSFFGINFEKKIGNTLGKVYYILTNLGKTNIYALGLGVITVITIIVCKKINRNLPGSLIGIIISAILVAAFSLETKGVKLTGEMAAALPSFKMLHMDIELLKIAFKGAIPIAIIGLVEAISIAKSIGSVSRQKIDADQEFIGQGIANAAASFFQCFAGSGSFTRSAVNFYSGAVTRFSGILSGIITAVILLFLAPFAKYIPMASIAGVIMIIAYSMINKKEMSRVSKVGNADAWVLWITFILTVVSPELDYAIYAGIVISIILYLKETNTVPMKILMPTSIDGVDYFLENEIESITKKQDILMIQLEGYLYFGSASDLEYKLSMLKDKAKVFIIRMKRVVAIDATSLETINNFIRDVKEEGGHIIICGVTNDVNSIFINSTIIEKVGRENIFLSEDEIFASSIKALNRARKINEQDSAKIDDAKQEIQLGASATVN